MKSTSEHPALWHSVPPKGLSVSIGTSATIMGLKWPIMTLTQARLSLTSGSRVSVLIFLRWSNAQIQSNPFPGWRVCLETSGVALPSLP
jgi:hypothetical protein